MAARRDVRLQFAGDGGVAGGWTTIENKLRDHSVNYFKDQLKKNGQLRNELEELIEAIAYEGIDNFKPQSGEAEKSAASNAKAQDTEYRDDL